MKHVSLSILFLAGVCISLYAQKVTNLRIDPSLAKGGYVSDYFESVRFVPLETTGESLVGHISKMEVSEKYYIIHDPETNSIVIFHRDGKFHKRLKPTKGRYFGDITLDEKNGRIIAINGDKISSYTLADGKKVKDIPRIESAHRLFYLGKDSFLLNIPRSLELSTDREIKYDVSYLDSSLNMGMSLFEYDTRFARYDYNLPSDIFTNQYDNTSIFSFPYKYDIHHLGGKGIIETYRFVFPLNQSLPAGFATDSAYAKIRKGYIRTPNKEDTERIRHIGPVFKRQNTLIFQIHPISSSVGIMNDNLMYDIDTGELTALNSISADTLSYHIPVLYPRFGQRLLSYRDDHLYTMIPSVMLLRLMKEDKHNTSFPSDLEQIMNQKNDNQNPIIIESKFR